MPRKALIDELGALHHIIIRGIERKKIFGDNVDRANFLDRLGGVLPETGRHLDVSPSAIARVLYRSDKNESY